MNKLNYKCFWLAVFCLVLWGNLHAQDVSVTAAVDRTVVPVNQPLVLTLTISGTQTNFSGVPELPPMPNFTIASGTNTSTSIQIINGRMTTTQSYNYTLIPNKVGKLTIGSMSVRIKGKDYKTEPIIIDAVQSPSPPQLQKQPKKPGEVDIAEELFILPVVSKKTAYPNEGVRIVYKLFTRLEVTDYGISKAPATTGFWAEEYPVNRKPVVTQEVYKGRRFQVATIKEMVVFPTHSGELTIQPLILEANIRVRPQPRRDVFDSFFDDAFFGRTIRRTLSSGPIKLNITPLPTKNKPVSFTNAVGNFRLNASVDKKDITTNEAVSLKVKISGTGNIKFIEEPKLEIEGDVEQYAPKINTDIKRGPKGVSGSKTFEYVLIPRIPGTKRIKPIEVAYFDPAKKEYVTRTVPEIPINVTKGKTLTTAISSNLTREEVKLLGQDVRFIKVGGTNWIPRELRVFRSVPEIFLLLFPILLVGVSVVYRRRLVRLSSDQGYARSIRAISKAQKHLKASEDCLGNGQNDKFFLHLTEALHGFIADKLNLDAAGLISSEVLELFQKRSVRQETIDALKECLEACDYSRFAPSSLEEVDLRKMLENTRAAIIDLEKQLKTNGR